MPVLRSNHQKYLTRNPVQIFLIRCFLKTIRDLFQYLPPGPLCDVGCGEGFVLRDLSDHGYLQGISAVGLDIDSEALQFASNRMPAVTFQKASAYQLPFHDKQFKCVMMLEVLEHLEYPEKALREAVRTGDYLILSVPWEPFFRIANFIRGKNWRRLGNDEGHINFWGKKAFKKLGQSLGEILVLKISFPWIVVLVRSHQNHSAGTH